MVLYIPFLLFIGGKTTLVSKATDAFYKLIRGFTCMYSDILKLVDPTSLGHGVIHCGEVFKECSSTFLLVFVVSFCGTLWFPLIIFPLACGAKEVRRYQCACVFILFQFQHGHWGVLSLQWSYSDAISTDTVLVWCSNSLVWFRAVLWGCGLMGARAKQKVFIGVCVWSLGGWRVRVTLTRTAA